MQNPSISASGRVSVLLVLAAFVVGLAVVPSARVEAVCYGTSMPQSFTWGIHGTESYQTTSTCNNDSWYYGKYHDSSTPNQSCMWIKYQDDGIWKSTVSACTTSWATYNYWDSDKTSPTYICDHFGCSSQYNHHGF